MSKRFNIRGNSNKRKRKFENKYSDNKFLNRVFSKFSSKNIRIIKSFIILSTISLLTTLVIGILSFVTINSAYNNLKLMYTSCLQREIIFNSLNIHLNTLRENGSLQIEKRESRYKDNVKTEIDNISEDLETFKSLEFSGDDITELNKMVDEQFRILKDTCNSITQLKNTDPTSQEINDRHKLNFQGAESNFLSSISTIIAKNKTDAEGLFNKTKETFFYGILVLIIFFIISIILTTLISIIVIRSLKKSIKSFTSILDNIAIGDFSINIETGENSEIGIMKKNLAHSINSVSNIFKDIKEGSSVTLEKAEVLSLVSKEMDETMQDVATAVQSMAKGTSIQSNELIMINETFSELGNEIKNIATSIKNVDERTKEVDNNAQNSSTQLLILIEAINKVSNSFENVSGKIQGLGAKISEINKITNVINNIAEETNLLSLNSSIEAARAGAAGNGFAVVANAIKKLAEQSKKSANDISKLIIDISNESGVVVNTTNGVNQELKQQINIIENSIEDFRIIIKAINNILPQVEEINNTVVEINNKKDKIIEKIHDAAKISEENTAASEEIAASTEEVTKSTEGLANTAKLLECNSNSLIKKVNNFKLKSDIE